MSVARHERRHVDGAWLERMRAARMEGAARRRMDRIGDLALNRFARAARSWRGRARHRSACACRDGVGRSNSSSVGAISTMRPRYITADARRHVPDHRQVVADEEIGQLELVLQIAHQVQDLRLHRHVERRRRLVAHDELRDWTTARGRCRCAGAGRPRIRADTWRRRRDRGRRGAAARRRDARSPALSLASPNALMGSAMMRLTRQRGLRLAKGSWKIICRRRRSFWRSPVPRRRPHVDAVDGDAAGGRLAAGPRSCAPRSICRTPTRPPAPASPAGRC